MIAEGNETPGGESGGMQEGRGRPGDSDLFTERRARRAAESGEHALTLRAEAAEATVRTLETHVASLQQRLGDAEQESRRIAELLDAERAPRHAERSEGARDVQPVREPALQRELQRASQREYAEQRLRVEAEDRGFELERESRSEIERLSRRLSASEREVQALGARLEVVQRELAEAEQTAATERSGMLRSERVLRARVSELEGTTLELHGALEAERAARRRAEHLLEALRDAQRSALGLLGSLADTIARLRASALASPAPAAPDLQPVAPMPVPVPPSASAPAPAAPSPAPAAPVELARAPVPPPAAPQGPAGFSVAAHVPLAEPGPGLSSHGRGGVPAQHAVGVPDELRSAEMAEALAAAVERLRARVEQHEEHAAHVAAPTTARPVHKHSMSLIRRTRLALRARRERRKQRRAG